MGERRLRYMPSIVARHMHGWGFCSNPLCSCYRIHGRVCRDGYNSIWDDDHRFGRCGNCGHRRWRHWFVKVSDD